MGRGGAGKAIIMDFAYNKCYTKDYTAVDPLWAGLAGCVLKLLPDWLEVKPLTEEALMSGSSNTLLELKSDHALDTSKEPL